MADSHRDLQTAWHHHARAQLLYASSGSLLLQMHGRTWVLPPSCAAWIPGGTRHRVGTRRCELRTVYFEVQSPDTTDVATVFTAPPLLRELALEVCRWGTAPPRTPAVEALLVGFRGLVEDWRRAPLPVGLPTTAEASPLHAALDRVFADLSHPRGLADAARDAGLSTRSFQRACRAELGMSFQAWLSQARLLRAIEHLASPTLEIGEVALRCGYESPSSFARAFKKALGVTPSQWRASGPSRSRPPGG